MISGAVSHAMAMLVMAIDYTCHDYAFFKTYFIYQSVVAMKETKDILRHEFLVTKQAKSPPNEKVGSVSSSLPLLSRLV